MERSGRVATMSVVVGMALACLGLLLTRALVPDQELGRTDANVAIAGYVATIATIYAVLLAFVVFVVWEQLNDARHVVEAEGSQMENLLRMRLGVPEPARSSLGRALVAYGDAVVREEWSVSRVGHRQGAGDVESARGALDAAWETVTRLEPTSHAEEVVHEQLIKGMDELSKLRSKRLLMDQQRMHPIMWTLLIGGALFTVASMALFQMESAWLHAVLSALLGGVLTFILFLVHDLDDPFDGIWQVEVEPISRALDAASLRPAPQMA